MKLRTRTLNFVTAVALLLTLDGTGALAKLEMVPMHTYRFRLVHAGTYETRWLAATLAHCGAELGTSVAIEEDRLLLKW